MTDRKHLEKYEHPRPCGAPKKLFQQVRGALAAPAIHYMEQALGYVNKMLQRHCEIAAGMEMMCGHDALNARADIYRDIAVRAMAMSISLRFAANEGNQTKAHPALDRDLGYMDQELRAIITDKFGDRVVLREAFADDACALVMLGYGDEIPDDDPDEELEISPEVKALFEKGK